MNRAVAICAAHPAVLAATNAVRKSPSHSSLLAAIALAATLVGTTSPALGQAPDQPQGTQPSTETVRSLVMNNWTDFLGIHYARQLYKADSRLFGPYLAALHSNVDWTVNQIDGATAFFRAEILGGDGEQTGPERPASLCESSGDPEGDAAMADPGLRQSYPTIMCFTEGGILNVEYVRETHRGLPIQIEKSYAMVPNRSFVVVRYTVINNLPPEDNRTVRVRFAEVLDLNNKAAPDHEEAADRLVETGLNTPQPGQPINDMQAQWYPELNAWIADMSASNGTFLVFGAFQDMDQHRVFGTVSDEIEFDLAVAPEMDAFDRPEPPASVDQMTGQDLGLAMWRELDLGPTGRQQYSFFYAVRPSLDEVRRVAEEARGPMNADQWFTETESTYQNWLQAGRPIDTPQDPGLRTAFNKGLVTNKQSQQPEFGSFIASTNPAYGFKVWPRDASVTALGFAATGHLDEAMKYYRWMASVQEDGSKPDYPSGTWYSNYSFWIRKWPKRFVEPEWDSLGLFMIGVYHTWRLLNERDPQAARAFLTDPFERLDQGPASVYEAVSRSAEYIANNINEFGFGPGDRSIWEEDFQWATFTQVTYASGLNAARLLAEQMGDARASEWADGGRRLLETIHRPASSSPCPGLWHDDESRWNRATYVDCTRDNRVDAATNLVWVFGLVDAADPRTDLQRQAVLARLTPGSDDIGIARYEGDEFYHENPFSPGGTFEANAAHSSWPQMDMYMAMLEHWRGIDDMALQRLQWYVRVTNVGYMPPGEGVDWTTDRPLPSTAAEPVTASWYFLGLFNYLDMFDPRLPPFDSMAIPAVASLPSPTSR